MLPPMPLEHQQRPSDRIGASELRCGTELTAEHRAAAATDDLANNLPNFPADSTVDHWRFASVIVPLVP